METCRFAVFNGVAYTTANELGAYLLNKGIILPSDDVGSRHYGSKFNKILIAAMKKEAPYSDLLPRLDYCDFPKLIIKDAAGNDVKDSDKFVKFLLQNNMCESSSVAIVKKGERERGLDLYTWKAAESLVRYLGDKRNITLNDDDFKFLKNITGEMLLKKNRVYENSNRTAQAPLFSMS